MKISKFGLKEKIIFAMLSAGLLPLIGYGVISSYLTSKAMQESAYAQMSSLRDVKQEQIQDYIEDVGKQLVTLAENTMTQNAAQAMSDSFFSLPEQIRPDAAELAELERGLAGYYQTGFGQKLKEISGQSMDTTTLIPRGEAARLAQHLYISANPHLQGEKDGLDRAEQDSLYSQQHAVYHPVFRSLLKRYGFYDLFLADPKSGHIVYSVFKELDFATSLIDGPYKNSNLASVYRKAMNGKAGEIYLEDYAPYLPSYNLPAWFISTPVFKEQELVGVLMFQLPVERISEILAKSISKDSETSAYLVDRQNRIVSHSSDEVFQADKHMALQSAALEQGLAGQSGELLAENYQGIEGISSFAPVAVNGLDWVLIVEVSSQKVFASLKDLQYTGAALALFGALFIVALAYLLGRDVLSNLGADPSRLSSVSDAIANERWEDEALQIQDTGKRKGVLSAMLAMKENIQGRILEERRVANESARVLQALDSVKSCVMVTDSDYNVIYSNKAFNKLRDSRGADLHSLIPDRPFEEKHIPVSGELRNILHSVCDINEPGVSPGRTEIQTGESHFGIIGGQVVDSEGNVLGGVFEWTDRTENVHIEQEIQSIVDSAREGDLSGRVEVDDKNGFFKVLGTSINQLVDVNEKSINETIASLSALAAGDLSRPMTTSYTGSFGELASYVNSTISTLSKVVGEIGETSSKVLSASNNLLEENTRLSDRTELQASNLEETASSMEEITS
ncbi:MAG: hypothetical protein KDJ38_17975, partial [Gammaproteobacteria bacterium]|nr:hypothetical protein [Gammaproteobacteria bacterium]